MESAGGLPAHHSPSESVRGQWRREKRDSRRGFRAPSSPHPAPRGGGALRPQTLELCSLNSREASCLHGARAWLGGPGFALWGSQLTLGQFTAPQACIGVAGLTLLPGKGPGQACWLELVSMWV